MTLGVRALPVKVAVRAMSLDDPACLALRCERVAHTPWLMSGPYTYGVMIAQLWEEGEGFILVEHDNVPWPGALRELALCEKPWCAFPYPLPDGRVVAQLGCTKFGDRLVEMMPGAMEFLSTVHFGGIDAAVFTTIQQARRFGDWPHLHTPPIAHVREPADGPPPPDIPAVPEWAG